MLAFFLSGFLAFLLSRFLAFLLTFLLSSLRELCFIFALALIRSVSSTTRHRNTRSKARGSSDNAQEEHAGNQRATTATAENRLAGKSLQKSLQNAPPEAPKSTPEAPKSAPGGLPEPIWERVAFFRPFLVLFWSSGAPLGALLGRSWRLLGPSWALLALSLALLGGSWGAFGPPGGLLGELFGALCEAPLENSQNLEKPCFFNGFLRLFELPGAPKLTKNQSKMASGVVLAPLGASWGSLGVSWRLLGRSWRVLVRSWRVLDRS